MSTLKQQQPPACSTRVRLFCGKGFRVWYFFSCCIVDEAICGNLELFVIGHIFCLSGGIIPLMTRCVLEVGLIATLTIDRDSFKLESIFFVETQRLIKTRQTKT